jgi:hypothetical protein
MYVLVLDFEFQRGAFGQREVCNEMIYIEKFESQESRRRLTILCFQFGTAEIQHGGVWAIRSQVRNTAPPGSMQATFAAEGFKATQNTSRAKADM